MLEAVDVVVADSWIPEIAGGVGLDWRRIDLMARVGKACDVV